MRHYQRRVVNPTAPVGQRVRIELGSEENDLRRLAEAELGPLTGRQWVRVRKVFRRLQKSTLDANRERE